MRPDGEITRGTTGINRLRRIDRWVNDQPELAGALRASEDPLVIDLGYGAAPTTTLEWARRLRRVRPDLSMLGLEIDPARVVPGSEGVEFGLGGFELAGRSPILVRALNVLRQYPEDRVPSAWERILKNLQPGGFLIEGTCDELGRRCCWILLDADGPRSLTLAWAPEHTGSPLELAERLPKALIHRNVAGEPIHALLLAADRAWHHCAGHAPFGPRARWRAAAELLARDYPIVVPRRWPRDNRLTIAWDQVAPN